MAMEQTYSRASFAQNFWQGRHRRKKQRQDSARSDQHVDLKSQRVIPVNVEQLPANKSCRRGENSSGQQR
jgi:hypothetical protein